MEGEKVKEELLSDQEYYTVCLIEEWGRNSKKTKIESTNEVEFVYRNVHDAFLESLQKS